MTSTRRSGARQTISSRLDLLVQLSPVTLQITFDATDADGPYRIEATVDDPDNDRVLRIATTVELLPDAPAP